VIAVRAAVMTPGVDEEALETSEREVGRERQRRADAPNSAGSSDEDGTGTSGGRRGGNRRAERAVNGRQSGKADKAGKADKDRGGRSPRPPSSGGSGPTTTAPPPSLALAVEPRVLAPFGRLKVASVAPCPSGTAVARVEVSAVGGTSAGSVVTSRDVSVAVDGSWSLAPFSVPVVGGIEGVDWAATADQVVVGASCVGGVATRYVSVTVDLEEVTVAPVLDATLTAGTVDATLTGCPTSALLHLVAAEQPPAPGEGFEPTSTVTMVWEEPASAWTAQAPAPAYEPSEGLWASASCLDGPGGATVWRTAPVALVVP
ncbi:MAG: hypothetical protein Q8K72_03030, partial [Acidimicrobiales bacterium]|nr:hypothetical protein [Acidimicrobiales bacterium]